MIVELRLQLKQPADFKLIIEARYFQFIAEPDKKVGNIKKVNGEN